MIKCIVSDIITALHVKMYFFVRKITSTAAYVFSDMNNAKCLHFIEEEEALIHVQHIQ